MRLVAAFALAVAATVLGVHAAMAACWWLINLALPFDLAFPRFFFSVNADVMLLLVRERPVPAPCMQRMRVAELLPPPA